MMIRTTPEPYNPLPPPIRPQPELLASIRAYLSERHARLLGLEWRQMQMAAERREQMR